MPLVAARCAWEVRAGIVPGKADPQHTKRWGLTVAEWEGPDGLHMFIERQALANAYASYMALLSSQGREVNWVECTFIWF